MLQLTPRLKAVASLIEKGSRVADIGTDHGLLPVYLMQKNLVSYIVATDCKEGPLRAVRENLTRYNLTEEIKVKKGWGLTPLQPGEVDTVVISGLGGNTILEIVDRAGSSLSCRYILQPVQHIFKLRRGLVSRGFIFEDELLVRGDGRYYTVISGRFQGAGAEKYSDFELMVGPVLLNKRPPILRGYLQELMTKWKKILKGLEESRNPENQKKRYQFFKQLIAEGQEVLNCLR